MGFDNGGALIRQVRTADGAMIVETCDTTQSPGIWSKTSDAATIGKVGEDWIEGRLRNEHARTLVQEESDGKTRAYDLFTGFPKADAWLTESFADLRGRRDFHNTVTWLTDDLKYIVSRPQALHNDHGRRIESFDFNGITYPRAEYGLLYTRPQTEPVVFRKPASDAPLLAEPPHGAYSIDGELLLLEIGSGSLRLFTPDGNTRFEWTKRESLRWDVGNAPFRQIDIARGRLVFFTFLRDPDDQNYGDDHLVIVLWDYKIGELRREIVELAELFDVKDGLYEPKRVEK